MSKSYMLRAIKEKGVWYIDDDNGFSKDENMLIAGVPDIIERYVGKDERLAVLKISDAAFADSVQLTLLLSSPNGSTYTCAVNGMRMNGWVCPVFFHYYKTAPDKLFINISPGALP